MTMVTAFLFLAAVAGSASVTADDRCLLESGGSTLRFLASEDLEVGGVVGELGVQGEYTDLELENYLK